MRVFKAFMNTIRIKFDLISCTCAICNGPTSKYSIGQCLVFGFDIK